MLYIRKIFTQDLRDGKQIAFPKEPSNVFFNFNYNTPDVDRQINFKFKENDSTSTNFDKNGTVIDTRLYSATSEARIDGELKRFLIDSLNAAVEDIIVFRKLGGNSFEFQFIPKGTENYAYVLALSVSNKNHEILITADENNEENDSQINKSINKIFFGAPGTGKSYKVKELTKHAEEENRVERVTFHPEYDYSSFIGGYKPAMDGENIRYEFVPQIFTNMYVKAWNDSENDYYLVIEEINRGNCAEIFGDIFQLLDRNSDYDITPSKELKEFLTNQNPEIGLINQEKGLKNGKLKLPSNLNFLATMNTSDQSLFPMDSAFKRRWDWEYIPINYDPIFINSEGEEKENESYSYLVKLPDGSTFQWIKFIEMVNKNWIKNNPSLGMDKCLGNYFIKSDDKTILIDQFINKAIFYLWNDVFKDESEQYNIFKGNSYEDFFPIQTNGVEKVKEILTLLKIDITSPIETE